MLAAHSRIKVQGRRDFILFILTNYDRLPRGLNEYPPVLGLHDCISIDYYLRRMISRVFLL